jgi:hypothetical protein
VDQAKGLSVETVAQGVLVAVVMEGEHLLQLSIKAVLVLQIQAVAAAVLRQIQPLTDLAATAVPASSSCAISMFTPSPTPAVVLHLPLQQMVTLRSQLSLQEQETFNLHYKYGTLRIS